MGARREGPSPARSLQVCIPIALGIPIPQPGFRKILVALGGSGLHQSKALRFGGNQRR